MDDEEEDEVDRFGDKELAISKDASCLVDDFTSRCKTMHFESPIFAIHRVDSCNNARLSVDP